jgi:hypothetical protein
MAHGHMSSTFWHPKDFRTFYHVCWAIVGPYKFLLKLTMQNQCMVAMELPFDYNPTIRLWGGLGLMGFWIIAFFNDLNW